jgi:hypothetical protein
VQAPRRRSARAISQKASDTSAKTTARNNVASALTSGLTPRLTLENTAIGKVVAEGPVTRLAMTSPSSASSVPRSTVNDTSSTAMTAPKRLLTPAISSSAIPSGQRPDLSRVQARVRARS